MKKIALLFFLTLLLKDSKSQDANTLFLNASKTITSNDLRRIVYNLSSRDMEGRGIGTTGIERASLSIMDFFKTRNISYIPILNDYQQKIEFLTIASGDYYFAVGKKRYKRNKDFYGTSGSFQTKTNLDIVFAGKGTTQQLKNIDLKNKVPLILTYDLFFHKPQLLDSLHRIGCNTIILCNPFNLSQFSVMKQEHAFSSSWRTATLKQPKYVSKTLIDSITHTNPEIKTIGSVPYNVFKVIVSPKIASGIFGVPIEKLMELSKKDELNYDLTEGQIVLKIPIEKKALTSSNILGFIEGTELKDEAIVISAHYDHLGIKNGKVMYGADDNSSGVAAVLEISEAYAELVKNGVRPKRSIIFAAFTAEEYGLLGSKAFVSIIDSLKIKPILNLNIDMIGRGKDKSKESKTQKLIVEASKKDSMLINTIKSVSTYKDSLLLDFKLSSDFFAIYNSDQASFIQDGIPAAMFIRGLHSDYHTERDTPEKLDYKTMEYISRLIFKISWVYAKSEI